MSTAVTGAPARRSAWSARSELPHMTNDGVPFMNSATSELVDDVLDLVGVAHGQDAPFVLMRSSWIVPSPSGADSAS